jgi:precorrin-2 dehydrogenase/sirohydrochlorin ferrochelatase
VRNLVVNIVDDPGKGNFFVPAVVRRGALTIAVSTEGKSPMLARKIREELERAYGPQFSEFLELLGQLRERVINNETSEQKKRNLLEELVSEEILDLLKEGRLELVKERLHSAYRGSGLEP